MTEQTFLQERGVTVTNARFVISSQTYAMSAITSVKTVKRAESKTSPVILGVVSMIVMLAGKGTALGGFGLLFLVIAVVWFMIRKPRYIVLLNSASGEAEVLTSKDAAFIKRVVDAVNQAMVARG